MKKLPYPAIIAIGIAILAILIYIHYDLFSYLGQFDDLEKYGIEEKAQISELSEDRLEYSYPVEDTIYRHVEILSDARKDEVWQVYDIATLEQDPNITVLYQHSEPSIVKVKTKEKSHTKLIIVVLLDAIMLNLVAFLAMHWYRQKVTEHKNSQL